MAERNDAHDSINRMEFEAPAQNVQTFMEIKVAGKQIAGPSPQRDKLWDVYKVHGAVGTGFGHGMASSSVARQHDPLVVHTEVSGQSALLFKAATDSQEVEVALHFTRTKSDGTVETYYSFQHKKGRIVSHRIGHGPGLPAAQQELAITFGEIGHTGDADSTSHVDTIARAGTR